MIGNTVEFYLDNKKTEGVILDKFIDAYSDYGLSKQGRDIYTFCLVDFYLVRLKNGDILKIQPSDVKKIISFYNGSIFSSNNA
jgi:hypothetical protein